MTVTPVISDVISRLVGALRPSSSLGRVEQALVDELRRVQGRIARSIDLANLHDDPLKFPLQAISEIAELQVTTHVETIGLLRQVIQAADQVNKPSEALRTQIARSFAQISFWQWFRFATMLGVLVALTVITVGVLVAWTVVEAHRNTPDAEALMKASGLFPAPWAAVMQQNDLPSMVKWCAEPGNARLTANGRRYCNVPMILDGVKAEIPALPAWAQGPGSGEAR